MQIAIHGSCGKLIWDKAPHLTFERRPYWAISVASQIGVVDICFAGKAVETEYRYTSCITYAYMHIMAV